MLKVFLCLSAAEGGHPHKEQHPCHQHDKLHPKALGLGVHRRHAGKMVQRFRQADDRKPGDAIQDKGLAQPIGRAEKTAEENAVKQGEEDEQPAQVGKVRVHHGIFGVDSGFPQGRQPHRSEHRAQQPAQELDEDAEGVLGPDDILLFAGQQRRIQDIIALPCHLEGVEDAQRDEEPPHQNGIAGDQGHKGKGQKEIGDGRGSEPQLLFEQLIHASPSFSRCTMISSSVGSSTGSPSNSGVLSRRMSRVSPAFSRQRPSTAACCSAVSPPCRRISR